MSVLSKVVSGRQSDPFLVLVYGVEGIGKSTFAAYAPNPIFLTSERGTSYLNVSRLFPESFEQMKSYLEALLNEDHGYLTLVVDSLDWLEPIIHKKVLKDKGKGKTSIDDIGYAKGYVWALDYWRQILNLLNRLRFEKKMNVILIGHSIVKTFHDPNLPDGYERYQLKLHDKAAGLVKEFVDFILFATYETEIIFDEGKKNRGRGEGKRLLYTQHRPSFDAKSRLAIPFTINLSWKSFKGHCDKVLSEGEKDLVTKLNSYADQITDKFIQQKVKENIQTYQDNFEELKAIEIQVLNILS